MSIDEEFLPTPERSNEALSSDEPSKPTIEAFEENESLDDPIVEGCDKEIEVTTAIESIDCQKGETTDEENTSDATETVKKIDKQNESGSEKEEDQQ